jgi:hypothetical protein
MARAIMRQLVMVLVVGASLTVVVGSPASAGPAEDAAHACQQGGYASLQGTDGTTFKNAGECVSFVARGGTITNVSHTCSFVAGTSGCVVLDNVVVPSPGYGTSTTLAGMFTFAPITSWDPTTTVTVSGSGTWTTSTGLSGTWTADDRSSIYPTTFFDTISGTFTTCAQSDTRNVGVHFNVYTGGSLVGEIAFGLRDATWGTNGVQFQGFSTAWSGEPWGVHIATATAPANVSGVTLHC